MTTQGVLVAMSSSTAVARDVLARAEPIYRPLYRRRSFIVVLGLLVWSLLAYLARRFSGVFGAGDSSGRSLRGEGQRSPGALVTDRARRRRRSKRPSSRLPSMLVLLGIPGSGKTTWANEYKEKVKSSAVIISSDAIRMHLVGTVNDRSREDEVEELLLEEVKRNIDEGNTFIVDDCPHNLKASFRAKLLDLTGGSRYNPIVKKLSLRPSFADARIQRDVAEGKQRYIPSFAELESLYKMFRDAEAALHEEDWFMEKD
eukprot:gene7339-5173_t